MHTPSLPAAANAAPSSYCRCRTLACVLTRPSRQTLSTPWLPQPAHLPRASTARGSSAAQHSTATPDGLAVGTRQSCGTNAQSRWRPDGRRASTAWPTFAGTQRSACVCKRGVLAQLSSAQLSGGCDERLLAGAAMALVSHGRPRSPDGSFSETSARAALMRAARGDALMAQVRPAHCPTWTGAALGGGEQRLIARTNGRRRCARDSAVGRGGARSHSAPV